MTLLELLVAVALVGGMLALVAPSLGTPPPREGRLESVVRAARSAAIARAQTLSLSIAGNGDWTVHPLPPDDSIRVLGGTLDAPPSAPLVLQVSPVGACVPVTPLPAELAGWDAASCAPSRDGAGGA